MSTFRLKLSTQLGTSNIHTRAREIASASEILPQLFLSDYSTVLDVKELSRLGITHIVSVVAFEPSIPDTIPVNPSSSSTPNKEDDSSSGSGDAGRRVTLQRLHIRLEDAPEADLLSHLERTTEWIKRAVEESKDNKVLVHCLQGVSRSPTVVCAYLIATTPGPKAMRPNEAIEFVQSKRSVVSPNSGFRKQLEKFGERFVGNRRKLERNRVPVAPHDSSEANLVDFVSQARLEIVEPSSF
ncbi:phosphatases II [Dendrothele bispora CBS 962.96]|uniref:protein-tyrosine-phosphatase n=1 Tax=Dendrothele bispora (strain CBS 962.96) TaxID=1314807 RepID=A0A4S8MW15_DENBC|nr:phosphatases II [Dendrothele bispora CBS 962.96]